MKTRKRGRKIEKKSKIESKKNREKNPFAKLIINKFLFIHLVNFFKAFHGGPINALIGYHDIPLKRCNCFLRDFYANKKNPSNKTN